MAPKKILYICPNAKRAGAEQVTALCVRHHDRARFEPQLYFFSEGPLVEEMLSLGVKCHLHPGRRFPVRLRNPLSIQSEVSAIVDVIRREKVDLVHSVMGYGHVFGGLAAKLAGVPEVWFQHGPTGSLDWLTGRVPTRTIFVNSRFTQEWQAQYRAWAEKTRLVHLGVEPLSVEEWSASARKYRDAFPSDAVIFALVGRIAPMKGHLLFAKAAALLGKNTKARFLVVGDPFMGGDLAYVEELKVEISRAGMDSYFHFTGHLSPPFPAMAAADVIVNCSVVPEPFGLTIVEAMMLGKPVIAPAEGGPLEIVLDRETGMLFEPRDAESLSRAMSELLSPECRREMGEQGRARAMSAFHVSRMVREIEAEYEALLVT